MNDASQILTFVLGNRDRAELSGTGSALGGGSEKI